MPTAPVLAADALQASLAWQRQRLEYAAQQVAIANVPLPPTGIAATKDAATTSAAHSDFARALDAQPVRLSLEPGHPSADANGIVRYPAVDLAAEMTTMMSATRAYEASIRAYNLLKTMNAKSLEIGK